MEKNPACTQEQINLNTLKVCEVPLGWWVDRRNTDRVEEWWKAHTLVIVRKLQPDAANWGSVAAGQSPKRTKAKDPWVSERRPACWAPKLHIYMRRSRVNCSEFLCWVQSRGCCCFILHNKHPTSTHFQQDLYPKMQRDLSPHTWK